MHYRVWYSQPSTRNPGAWCLLDKREPQAMSFLHEALTQNTGPERQGAGRGLRREGRVEFVKRCGQAPVILWHLLYEWVLLLWLPWFFFLVFILTHITLVTSFVRTYIRAPCTFWRVFVLKGTVVVPILCFYTTLPRVQRLALLSSQVVLIMALWVRLVFFPFCQEEIC